MTAVKPDPVFHKPSN